MDVAIFILCAITLGFRDVWWPYSVRHRTPLPGIAAHKAGDILLSALMIAMATIVSLIAVMALPGVDSALEGFRDSEATTWTLTACAATAMAWCAALGAQFSRLGPARADILDWGSLPLFQVVLGVSLGEASISASILTATLMLAGIFVFLLSHRQDTTAEGKLSSMSGAILALISGAAGAVMLHVFGQLWRDGVDPISVLPWRLIVTTALLAVLFKGAGGRLRTARAFEPRAITATFWVSLVYVGPLIVLFTRLNNDNLSTAGHAFSLIPFSALAFEQFVFGGRSVRKMEWIALVLFILAYATSLSLAH